MIGKIFLGRPWHWAVIVIASGLLWFCGSKRLHVIEFNWFIIAMLLGTGLSVFAIIKFHRDGERVTREELVHHEFDPDDSAAAARE